MDAICERCGARTTGTFCGLCGTRVSAAPPPPPPGPMFAVPPPPPPPPPASSRRGLIIGAVAGVAVLLAVAVWLFQRQPTAVPPNTPGAGPAATISAPNATDDPPPGSDPQSMPLCDLGSASISATSTAPDGIDASERTVSYAAQNLIDGDSSTAWRTPGTGVGEVITLDFPEPCRLSSISLLNGYHKVDFNDSTDRWKQNRRVSRLEVRSGSKVETAELDAGSRTWQVIGFGADGVSQLTLQILGSAPAKPARDFTAMSELRLA